MESPLFCCTGIKPYPRATSTEKDHIFIPFVTSAENSCTSSSPFAQTGDHALINTLLSDQNTHAIQLVQQVNYGPIVSKRYFVPNSASSTGAATGRYIEIQEQDLIEANFQKVNSYKNFRCGVHNRFFEINLYKKDPVNKHHWRVNIARPGREIDL